MPKGNFDRKENAVRVSKEREKLIAIQNPEPGAVASRVHMINRTLDDLEGYLSQATPDAAYFVQQLMMECDGRCGDGSIREFLEAVRLTAEEFGVEIPESVKQ